MNRRKNHQKLAKAVEKRKTDRVQTILQQEPWLVNRIVRRNGSYCSFLFLAAEKGYASIAKLLLTAKAYVNQQCFEGNTPLIVAATNGHVKMVKLLLQQPEIVVDLCDDLRQTPLHWATSNAHHDVVKLLKRVKTNSMEQETENRIDVLKKLNEAVEQNNVETVHCIVHQRPWLVYSVLDLKESQSFLFTAAKHGAVETARVLLQAKADVNQQCNDGATPLCIAATNGHAAIVQLLLELPQIVVDVPKDYQWRPLHHAAAKGHESIVQQLLDAKADVESVTNHGATALLTAVLHGHLPAIQVLLRHGANVNHQNSYGNCCLYLAAQLGRGDIALALLEASAAVDLTTERGLVPLMAAAESGRAHMVPLLVAAGADVNRRAVSKKTALVKASMYGHVGVVVELLKAGAEPNAADVVGDSALLVAARAGHVNCIAPLLGAKADIDAADHVGETALVWAIRNAEFAAAKQLLELGADWRKKAKISARQYARRGIGPVQALFECAVCGWDGMCCAECRKRYCALECDKFSDRRNQRDAVDCRLHRKVAHQAIVEWTLAISSLNLPPYVVEHIFKCLHVKSNHQDYQQRRGVAFLSIPKNSAKIDENFVHLIVEERTHLENIQVFIAVQNAKNRTK